MTQHKPLEAIDLLGMMGNIRDAAVAVSNHLTGDVRGNGDEINSNFIVMMMETIQLEIDVHHDTLVQRAINKNSRAVTS